MTNFFIGTHVFLLLIAERIDDSLTWCRFSQTCKKAYHICKKLIKYHEIKSHRGWLGPVVETFYTLPNGNKHGIARRYKFGKREEECPSNEYYYKNGVRRILSIDFWSTMGSV